MLDRCTIHRRIRNSECNVAQCSGMQALGLWAASSDIWVRPAMQVSDSQKFNRGASLGGVAIVDGSNEIAAPGAHVGAQRRVLDACETNNSLSRQQLGYPSRRWRNEVERGHCEKAPPTKAVATRISSVCIWNLTFLNRGGRRSR